MAIPKIHVTHSLDVQSVRTVNKSTRHWGCSKFEALWRDIR